MTTDGLRARPLLIVWALLGLLSVLWSLATPIAAAPDEPAHFIKAASVVRGQWIGALSSSGPIVQVPRYVAFAQAQTCFAFHSESTADCAPALRGDPWTSVSAATTAGLYNPVYYLLVGWPTLIFHDQTGLYAMRIVSALLSSLFLAVAIAQLLALRRRLIPVLAAAVAVTPMMLFLGSAVNPNSLEASATLAVFVTMFMVVRHPDPQLLPARAIAVTVSAAVAVTMRGLSPLWVLIALLAPLLLISPAHVRVLIHSRWARLATAVIALAALFAIVWIVATNSLGSAFASSAGSAAPGIGQSPIQGFTYVLFGTFDYAKGLVGVFGWLDAPAPDAVFFLWSAFAGCLALLAFAVTRGRERAMGLVLLVAVVLLPAVLQGVYIRNGGIIWQGRYDLPLFLCLVVGLGLNLSARLPDLEPRAARSLAAIVGTAWGIAQLYSFGTALRRYAVGLTGDLGAMVGHPAWNPPLGIVPLLLLTAAAIAAVTIGLIRASTAGERDGHVGALLRH